MSEEITKYILGRVAAKREDYVPDGIELIAVAQLEQSKRIADTLERIVVLTQEDNERWNRSEAEEDQQEDHE